MRLLSEIEMKVIIASLERFQAWNEYELKAKNDLLKELREELYNLEQNMLRKYE